VGGTPYISGRIGIDPATGMAGVGMDEELRLLFDEFEAVLAVQIFAPT
jgi:enamine deaminase RidA (YjgF/YER057c/UK114 family)